MAATTPQDHKRKNAPYPIEIGGETYLLAPPKAGLMRRVRKLDAMDLMFTLFEACSPDLETDAKGELVVPASSPFLTALDELDSDELMPLFEAWMGSMGGGDAGKSGGSSS